MNEPEERMSVVARPLCSRGAGYFETDGKRATLTAATNIPWQSQCDFDEPPSNSPQENDNETDCADIRRESADTIHFLLVSYHILLNKYHRYHKNVLRG